jgi:hypothetical protein
VTTHHVLGVPLRSGSPYPGSANDAQGLRDARLLARLQAAGCAGRRALDAIPASAAVLVRRA